MSAVKAFVSLSFPSIVLFLLLSGPLAAADETEQTPSQDQGSEDAGGGAQMLSFADLPSFEFGDEDFNLQIGGRIVLDAVRYSHANHRRSGFELDDARLVLSGEYRSFRWFIEPDLIGVDTPRQMYEAWGAVDLDPALRLTAGQLRVALGSEFATREEALPVTGYALTSYLDGRYDMGLRADGIMLAGGLWYEMTATLGNGFGLEGHRRQSPQISVRLVSHPFHWIRKGAASSLSGLFLGIALAHSDEGDDPIVVATPLESIVFQTPDLDGDATRWRHLELGYRSGPFRLGWENVAGCVDDVPIGGGRSQDIDQITGWSFYAAWNPTGEEHRWSQGRWVVGDFDESHAEASGIDRPDRWELAARYTNADIDRNLFVHGITSYDRSTQEVRTINIDLSWYPVEHTRIALAWVKTIADHELNTFGGTNRDSSFLLRLALTF